MDRFVSASSSIWNGTPVPAATSNAGTVSPKPPAISPMTLAV